MANVNAVNLECAREVISDQDLARVAGLISAGSMQQIGIQYLGLTRIDVDRCYENALRKSNHSWLFVFNCLYLWKQKNDGSRQMLFQNLTNAAKEGLLCRSGISFLLLDEVPREATTSPKPNHHVAPTLKFQPLCLEETRCWDPAVCQITMCKKDEETFLIRGASDTAPYTHRINTYRKDGTLEHSWPSKCSHDWSMGIQCIIIGATNYVAESCPDCQEIRLYTKDGFKRIAFYNKAYCPGKMCPGPNGFLFVYDRYTSDVLKLDCSTENFQIASSLETGVSFANGMSFVATRDMLIVTTQRDHMIKALNASTGDAIWCMHGRVEGRWLHPWDVRFDPQTGYLFVADGDNKRILLLSLKGKIMQNLLQDTMGAVYRLAIFQTEPRLLVRDSYPNHTIKCYIVTSTEKNQNQYGYVVHPVAY